MPRFAAPVPHVLFPAPLVDYAVGTSIGARPILGTARPFALVSIVVGEVDDTGLQARYALSTFLFYL